ncbi:MAG: 2-dehydropantoate 2-reductase [Isosphaeraceae bacterium]
MRIVIVGAGGVGGYFGGLLARAGHEVVMLARGPHLAALQERGIEVRTPDETFQVSVTATDDPKALGRADYVIVAVKGYSLSEVAHVVRTLAEAGSVIVPLLNGVEVVDRLIGHGVLENQILGGLTSISAVRIGPGVVERLSPFQRVVVGEVAGGTSDRVERIVEALRVSGAEAEASDDINAAIWRKFAFIASMAAACGVARLPIGPLQATELGRSVIDRLVREALAVGRSRGVALPETEADRILDLFATLPAAMKPSLLLDLEAGGPTEIDDLSGAVSRLGRQLGIETPSHDRVTATLGVKGTSI